MVYNFNLPADNPDIRLDTQFTPKNVEIKDGNLILIQRGYTEDDRESNKPVSIAGLQTKDTNIVHGTFRATMKLGNSDGGSCASFFWYHNDRSEIDIEAVTKGTSLVNDTINYTNHPSTNEDGTPIEDATLSIPLTGEHRTDMTIYREHRFDSDASGVKFFLDGNLIKTDDHNVPQDGGSLQLKLWADGNR